MFDFLSIEVILFLQNVMCLLCVFDVLDVNLPFKSDFQIPGAAQQCSAVLLIFYAIRSIVYTDPLRPFSRHLADYCSLQTPPSSFNMMPNVIVVVF